MLVLSEVTVLGEAGDDHLMGGDTVTNVETLSFDGGFADDTIDGWLRY